MSRRRREKREAREREELLTRREAEAIAEKKLKTQRLFLTIFAIVAVVATVVAIAVPVIIGVVNSAVIDYENDNLENYIYISEDDYKNYLAKVKMDPVDDLAIDHALIQHLAAYRKVNGSGNYLYTGTRKLTVGDTIRYYYYGYMLDEAGNKVPFSSNIADYTGMSDASSTAANNYIGEGGLIPGFELGLIGKNPGDYSSLSLITNRATEEGDYISVTYSLIPPDANKAEADITVLIKLDRSVTDAEYGVGFTDKFIGKLVGESVPSFALPDVNGVDGMTSYTKIKINGIYDLGDNPLTVTARFPMDYPNGPDLAGKVAYFDVYIPLAIYYDVPEVNDEFLKEKLRLDDEGLQALEGANAKEKYRNYIKSTVTRNSESVLASAIEDEMWKALGEKVKVKYLPNKSVMEYYNDYVDEIVSSFNAAASNGTANNLDGYALTYLELGPKDDWRAYLLDAAKARVSEKVLFYYITRREGFIPSDEEYKKLYNETVEEYLDMYLNSLKIYPENYEKYEDYLKVRNEKRPEVLKVYNEEYMRENVLYVYGIEKMIALAKVEITNGATIEGYTRVEF